MEIIEAVDSEPSRHEKPVEIISTKIRPGEIDDRDKESLDKNENTVREFERMVQYSIRDWKDGRYCFLHVKGRGDVHLRLMDVLWDRSEDNQKILPAVVYLDPDRISGDHGKLSVSKACTESFYRTKSLEAERLKEENVAARALVEQKIKASIELSNALNSAEWPEKLRLAIQEGEGVGNDPLIWKCPDGDLEVTISESNPKIKMDEVDGVPVVTRTIRIYHKDPSLDGAVISVDTEVVVKGWKGFYHRESSQAEQDLVTKETINGATSFNSDTNMVTYRLSYHPKDASIDLSAPAVPLEPTLDNFHGKVVQGFVGTSVLGATIGTRRDIYNAREGISQHRRRLEHEVLGGFSIDALRGELDSTFIIKKLQSERMMESVQVPEKAVVLGIKAGNVFIERYIPGAPGSDEESAFMQHEGTAATYKWAKAAILEFDILGKPSTFRTLGAGDSFWYHDFHSLTDNSDPAQTIDTDGVTQEIRRYYSLFPDASREYLRSHHPKEFAYLEHLETYCSDLSEAISSKLSESISPEIDLVVVPETATLSQGDLTGYVIVYKRDGVWSTDPGRQIESKIRIVPVKEGELNGVVEVESKLVRVTKNQQLFPQAQKLDIANVIHPDSTISLEGLVSLESLDEDKRPEILIEEIQGLVDALRFNSPEQNDNRRRMVTKINSLKQVFDPSVDYKSSVHVVSKREAVYNRYVDEETVTISRSGVELGSFVVNDSNLPPKTSFTHADFPNIFPPFDNSVEIRLRVLQGANKYFKKSLPDLDLLQVNDINLFRILVGKMDSLERKIIAEQGSEIDNRVKKLLGFLDKINNEASAVHNSFGVHEERDTDFMLKSIWKVQGKITGAITDIDPTWEPGRVVNTEEFKRQPSPQAKQDLAETISSLETLLGSEHEKTEYEFDNPLFPVREPFIGEVIIGSYVWESGRESPSYSLRIPNAPASEWVTKKIPGTFTPARTKTQIAPREIKVPLDRQGKWGEVFIDFSAPEDKTKLESGWYKVMILPPSKGKNSTVTRYQILSTEPPPSDESKINYIQTQEKVQAPAPRTIEIIRDTVEIPRTPEKPGRPDADLSKPLDARQRKLKTEELHETEEKLDRRKHELEVLLNKEKAVALNVSGKLSSEMIGLPHKRFIADFSMQGNGQCFAEVILPTDELVRFVLEGTPGTHYVEVVTSLTDGNFHSDEFDVDGDTTWQVKLVDLSTQDKTASDLQQKIDNLHSRLNQQ